jgi:CxxC-x17-CxxC domain-containing protein
MPDLELNCIQCKQSFIFTEKEQAIFYQRNLHFPQYCPKCRSRKAFKKDNEAKRFEIICDHCGKKDQVPFQPKIGREVLCRECYKALKAKTRFA